MGGPEADRDEGVTREGGCEVTAALAPFVVVTDDQRTPDWHQARVGRLTGTCAADMLATIKSGEAAARRDLRARLVAERLSGQSQEDGYVSKDMQRGADLEADAICAYELVRDVVVQPVGFLAHPDLLAGCSPDGQIANFAGLVEVKCPKTATHIRYLREQTVPRDYLHQITHNLWITGAQWCDFISFDPRLPEGGRLFIKRVMRADVDLAAYELCVRSFLAEVEKELAEVSALLGAGAAA